MKRGTPDHPKTRRLMAELDLPLFSACGLLELLWHFTTRYAPRGDVGRYDAAQIAAAVGWTGDPAFLVATLTACGWLDVSRRHGVLVHDWPEHADDYVHVALARRKMRFADGTVPNMSRLKKQERLELQPAFERSKSASKAQAVPCRAVPNITTDTPISPSAPANGNGHPPPPADAGESRRKERQEARTRIAARLEEARLFAISNGQHPTRKHLRKFREWFTSGLSLADVQRRIEDGEHLPRSRL